ncbi:hypothetical protein [Dactylosporangium matsuzakiense]|uniref:WD40 repeat protein n=1 Tax=Dactylosporangium matsuzakiense TaxID=53360 RepID=A0A9W6KE59_9ACTN|nr:hypothetical protein [Dactylosporangium matsuzakiense]GLK98640.1 hypothetical protein GCM10017581_003810 [Dactylosporangium matsuzakiense]
MEETEFSAFVAERAHALLRTAYALTGDRHAAEDLVQSAGDRVVSGYLEKDSGESGFAIIDARTGKLTRHVVDRTHYDCDRCEYAFTRNGKEVLMPIADRSGGEGEQRVLGLQFFNAATGTPTRTVLVRVEVPDSPFAFSPDGRWLIAKSDSTGAYQRVDLTNRATVPFPFEAVWVTDTVLIGMDDLELLTLHPDGSTGVRFDLGIPSGGLPIVLGPPD